MPNPEKVRAVAEIKERLENAKAVFLAEYAGLSVKDQQTLRRSLRQHGAEFKVVKMTLARRAAAELDIDSLDELLLGPTGLAFADEDAVGAAKALRDFARDHEVFTIKGGLLGREFLTPERVNELAAIESRQALLATMLRDMRAPLANFAGLMAALPRGFATAVQQLLDKMPDEQAPSGDLAIESEAADAESDDGADGEPDVGVVHDVVAAESGEPDGTDAEKDGDDPEAPAAGPEDETHQEDNDDDPAEEAEEE